MQVFRTRQSLLAVLLLLVLILLVGPTWSQRGPLSFWARALRRLVGARRPPTRLRPEEPEQHDPSSRIYRGWHVRPHEFPWMVKVMVGRLAVVISWISI